MTCACSYHTKDQHLILTSQQACTLAKSKYQKNCKQQLFDNMQNHISYQLVYNYVADCFPPLEISSYNSMSGTLHNRVYVNLNFLCHGKVTAWKYMARQAGSIYFDVYRPETDGTQTLISKTKVSAASSGEFIHRLGVSEYIRIHPGYHIGYHYQYNSGIAISNEVWATQPMNNLPYSDDELSGMIAVKAYDDTLTIGSKQGPTLHTQRGLPTFMPIIECKYNR